MPSGGTLILFFDMSPTSGGDERRGAMFPYEFIVDDILKKELPRSSVLQPPSSDEFCEESKLILSLLVNGLAVAKLGGILNTRFLNRLDLGRLPQSLGLGLRVSSLSTASL